MPRARPSHDALDRAICGCGDAVADGLTAGETELLIDGLTDDVAFHAALIDLGIRANPPVVNQPPGVADIDAAFESFQRLVVRGLVTLGRIEYVDPTQPPGIVAPVKHLRNRFRS